MAVSVMRDDSWEPIAWPDTLGTYFVSRLPSDIAYNIQDRIYGVWGHEANEAPEQDITDVGDVREFTPDGVRAADDAVAVTFGGEDIGTLTAYWRLATDSVVPTVELEFAPDADGHYMLGYRVPWTRTGDEISEALMPPKVFRKRLPDSGPRTILSPLQSAPMAAVQDASQPPTTLGIAADPSAIDFRWPQATAPDFGMVLQNAAQDIQPAIAGPVPGTETTHVQAGATQSFAFRPLAVAGTWYDGYRAVADDVFGLDDYRRNWNVSLTDSVHNMIELLKDDDHGGWWPRAKGFYQIESKNSATQSAPALLISLYRLTNDEEIYRRRAVPSIEYTLSRSGHHFTPVPSDAGPIVSNGLTGAPNPSLGATTFGAMYELTNRRTDALRAAAVGERDSPSVNMTSGFSHAQAFDDLATAYETTGDESYLQRAKQEADAYIERRITTPPTEEYRSRGFFLIQIIPNWEGLLHLYELTGEDRYLDAAAVIGRWLLTGTWIQPTVPDGSTTIHEGGRLRDSDGLLLWKGAEKYRLGFDDTGEPMVELTEHDVPSWLVSSVGLSFEQLSTIGRDYLDGIPARLIYQSVWASNFLKLAAYTEDDAFQTHARNAVIGRFANYPGYYANGQTDLPLDPEYPFTGPDRTQIYYHHLPVHLGWCIDYLVSEATLRTDGNVRFPSKRQVGYAFFNFRVYGHAPGTIFDFDGVWPWFDREAVTVDQPQFNHLLAADGDRTFVVLMNEDQTDREGTITGNADALETSALDGTRVTIHTAAGEPVREREVQDDELATVGVPAGEARVLVLHGIAPSIDTHRVDSPDAPGSGTISVETDARGADADTTVAVHAAPIQIDPDRWNAYVWLDAAPEDIRQATLEYDIGDDGQTETTQLTQYPYEHTIPVDSFDSVSFTLTGVDSTGEEFASNEEAVLVPSR
jgi:hypothetical protein